MEIEITGYDVVNGSRTHHRKKSRTVKSIQEVDAFELEMKQKYEQKHGHTVTIYAVYTTKSL